MSMGITPGQFTGQTVTPGQFTGQTVTPGLFQLGKTTMFTHHVKKILKNIELCVPDHSEINQKNNFCS